MIIRGVSLYSRMAVIFAFMLTLAACGGSGGTGDNFFEGGEEYNLEITLYDAAGNQTLEITRGGAGTVRVKVRGGKEGILVSASTNLGALLPLTGTALTNGDGVATFTLEAGVVRGGGTISASATVDEQGVSATLDFQVGISDVQLGYFDNNGVFIANQIGVEPNTTLAGDGRAQLTVAILDPEGLPVLTPQAVTFSSQCLTSGLASIDPASPVTSVNGRVQVTYSVLGCSGIDEVAASVDGANGQAFATITIGAADAADLLYLGAEPSIIGLADSGISNLPKASVVSFQVVDRNNLPIQGVSVEFETSSTGSGAGLDPVMTQTNSNGVASTTLTSGDVPTQVSVIATASSEGGSQQVSTISDPITITSGLPEQSNIKLTMEGDVIVSQGMTVDGIGRTLTVTMSDNFGLPVPDGTVAEFEAEFGQVDGTCQTGVSNGTGLGGVPASGTCSVLWVTGDPRVPEGTEQRAAVQTITNNPGYNCTGHNGSSGPCPTDLGYTRGGRSTVYVRATGQENFTDSNGNWIMDPEEQNDFDNLAEASLDKNEDGTYTPALAECESDPTTAQCVAGSEETYSDFNFNGEFDLNDDPAVYNGLSCPESGDGVYCSRELVEVRADLQIVLSEPENNSGANWDVILTRSGIVRNSTSFEDVYTAYISDLYNNQPPSGTLIEVFAAGDCDLLSAGSFAVTDSARKGAFAIGVQTGGVGAEAGSSLSITVTPPDSAPYTENFGCIPGEPEPDPDPDPDPDPAP